MCSKKIREMMTGMFRPCHELKIFNSVIVSYFVFVVNYFAAFKISTKMFFHHKNMLKNIMTFFRRSRVTLMLVPDISFMMGNSTFPPFVFFATVQRFFTSIGNRKFSFCFLRHFNPLVPWRSTFAQSNKFFFKIGTHRDASIPCDLIFFKFRGWRQVDSFFAFIPCGKTFLKMRSSGITKNAFAFERRRSPFIGLRYFLFCFFGAFHPLVPRMERFSVFNNKHTSTAQFFFDVFEFLRFTTLRALASVAKMVFEIAPAATRKLFRIDRFQFGTFETGRDFSSFHGNLQTINQRGGF